MHYELCFALIIHHKTKVPAEWATGLGYQCGCNAADLGTLSWHCRQNGAYT